MNLLKKHRPSSSPTSQRSIRGGVISSFTDSLACDSVSDGFYFCSRRQERRLAKLVTDKVITPHRTTVLYPKTGGNLHCFTALTPCVVLDILTPPYKRKLSQSCDSCMDYPFSTFGMQTFSIFRTEEH
ncbi:hypothetical protein Bca4012_074402 [Brassica carinata]